MKTYWLTFGSGDPRVNTGLTPTMVLWITNGTTAAAPGISEIFAGTGFYTFQYGPTLPVAFLCDGGAILTGSDRYVKGALDPIQAVDEKVGTLSDSFGTTAIDPTTVIGWLKRTQEFLEGNATFAKSTGTWDIYSRGSSTLLREKVLTNTTTAANKS